VRLEIHELIIPEFSQQAPIALVQLDVFGLVEEVNRIDKTSGFRLAGDNQALGTSATVEEANPVHQGSGSDTAGRKENGLATG
jgi:hypothetical protein